MRRPLWLIDAQALLTNPRATWVNRRAVWSVLADRACQRAAWWVPRRLALFVFIRVYASTGRCGPDYYATCRAWETGLGK